MHVTLRYSDNHCQWLENEAKTISASTYSSKSSAATCEITETPLDCVGDDHESVCNGLPVLGFGGVMGQARIVEVDYYQLVEKMKRASDAKRLIEKKDKEKWKAYITEHKVRETSLQAFGKVKFMSGPPRLVAIDLGESWDGCYAFSKEDEAALKWDPGK